VVAAPPPPRVVVAAPTIRFEAPPPLVVVQPGVQVVEDADEEIFFVGGWYWHPGPEGVWYRTRSYRGGWEAAPPRVVPAAIVRMPRGQYRHFRGEGRGERHEDNGWHGERHEERGERHEDNGWHGERHEDRRIEKQERRDERHEERRVEKEQRHGRHD
jgi:hypothetical protein